MWGGHGSSQLCPLQPPCLPLPTRGSRNSFPLFAKGETGCWDCWRNSAVHVVPVQVLVSSCTSPALIQVLIRSHLGFLDSFLVALPASSPSASWPRLYPAAAGRSSRTHPMALLPCFTVFRGSTLPLREKQPSELGGPLLGSVCPLPKPPFLNEQGLGWGESVQLKGCPQTQ